MDLGLKKTKKKQKKEQKRKKQKKLFVYWFVKLNESLPLYPAYLFLAFLYNMSSTITITSQDILNDRAARKAAGLVGCLTTKPSPEEINFFGFRDVQIWNMDAQGRLNGDPEFDRMNPHCFCYDCRGAFDGRGEVDAQLVNSGHSRALDAYRNIVPPSSDAVPDVLPASNIPTSLPPPIPRDIMNESPEDRLRRDLTDLRAKIQSDLVVIMDSRRRLDWMEPDEARNLAHQIDDEESDLWAKIRAIDLLLN